ncbi:MAG: ATP-binding protein [Bdellovibrionales bacterium]
MNKTAASQPWIRGSAFGFTLSGLGALALVALHVPHVGAVIPANELPYFVVGSFLVTTLGFFVTLQKFFFRREILRATRIEAAWRDNTLNTAPFGIVICRPNLPPVINATAQTWLGLTAVEQCAQLADRLVAGDRGLFVTLLEKLQGHRETFTLETRVSLGERPLRITAGLLPDNGFVLWLLDRNEEKDRETAWQRERSGLEAEIAKLSVVGQALPRPLWLRRLTGQIVWCNNAYAAAMEMPADEIIEKQIEFAPAMMAQASRDLARKALDTGEMQVEERHVVVEGTRKLFRIFETPVIVEGYIVGLALDQTLLEDTKNELARHVSAFEETLEQLGAPIAIFDGAQKLRFYNQSYQRLWQFEEAFVRTAPTYSEVLDDLRQRRKIPEVVDFQRFRREQLARFTSLIESAEELMHLPDGTTIRVLYIPHPLGGLMLVTEDVTDKLALESSYNTLIAVQQETLDNLAEGVMVLGSDGRVKLFNPSLARIWQLDADTLDVNPHLADVLDQMKPLLDYSGDWDVYRQQVVAEMLDRNARQHRIVRADRSIVDASSVPLPDGNVLHSYLDVTDTARVETALRTTNRALAAADKLKSEFVANVSYQLRTPLSTIIGFAEILTNQYFGALNDRQMDYAKTILEASRKLLALINTVLDLATIEAGRMLLNRRPVEIARLLGDVAGMIKSWAQRQQLDVIVEPTDKLMPAEIDERRMQQVLFNLLTNAVQYTPPGGRIVIGARQQGDQTIIMVTDTGIGMTDAERERAFNKFERANPQARQPGVGLGLSLVKSLVELHNGQVEIFSEVNKGTQVVITLPTRVSGQQVEDNAA